MDSSAPCLEADLARVLNMHRDVLRKLRAQLEPGDFIAKNGAPVLITSQGIARIYQLLEKRPPSAPGSQPVGPPALADHYVTLTITKVLATGRMLLAKKTGALPAETVRVRVRSCENFIPGMEIPKCEASEEHPGLYFYHGRQPRFRGQRLIPR